MQLRTLSFSDARKPQGAMFVSAVLVIFFGFLVLRLPFRAKFLVNWDAVNFALGTHAFEIANHQPHPPGYIGYIVIGWLLNRITGDANASFTFVSALSGALGPVILFVLGTHFLRRRYAALAAILFGLSPVVWYYSEVALSYSLEMAIALLFLVTCYRAWRQQARGLLYLGTLLLAGLGAIRQSGMALLIPLWLYIIWSFPWPARRRAIGVFIVGNLLWFVPLVWLAGGPVAYVRDLSKLMQLVVEPTSLASRNPWGLMPNFGLVVLGLLVGINFGLFILGAAYWRGVNPFARLSRQDRIFFILWITPALLTYLLVHTGQVGYILLILPAIFLWIGSALSELERQLTQGEWRSVRLPLRTSSLVLVGLVGLFVVANVTAFFDIPKVVHAFTEEERGLVQNVTGTLNETQPGLQVGGDEGQTLAAGARQYDLKRNDAYWEELIALIRMYNSETTAVLSVPHPMGSFRHLTYYLEEYRVYGVGKDRDKRFGHLFTSEGLTSDYSVEGLETARTTLMLRPAVRTLIIPDQAIYDRLDEDISRYTVLLEDGEKVVVVSIPPETTLTFIEDHDDVTTISAKPSEQTGGY